MVKKIISLLVLILLNTKVVKLKIRRQKARSLNEQHIYLWSQVSFMTSLYSSRFKASPGTSPVLVAWFNPVLVIKLIQMNVIKTVVLII